MGDKTPQHALINNCNRVENGKISLPLSLQQIGKMSQFAVANVDSCDVVATRGRINDCFTV